MEIDRPGPLQPLMDTEHQSIAFVDTDGRIVGPTLKIGQPVTIVFQEMVLYEQQAKTGEPMPDVGVLGANGMVVEPNVMKDAKVIFCNPLNPAETNEQHRDFFYFVIRRGDMVE